MRLGSHNFESRVAVLQTYCVINCISNTTFYNNGIGIQFEGL